MRTDSGHGRIFSTPSIIASLRRCTGMTDAQLCVELAERAGCAAPAAHLLQSWDAGDIAMPAWVERGCAEWIMTLWRGERATCSAHELLEVDRKFTRLLRDYSVADLMAVLRPVTPHCAA